MKITVFVVLLLSGCASVEMTALQQAACKLEQCHVLTTQQLQTVITHYTNEALKSVFEAGIDHGSTSCKKNLMLTLNQVLL